MDIEKNTDDQGFIISVENKLISTFLNDASAAKAGCAELRAECFVEQQNANIFSAIKNLMDNNKKVDDVTVNEFLSSDSKLQFQNFKSYVMNANSAYTTSANIDDYIEIVRDAYIKRNIDSVCKKIINSKVTFAQFDKTISSYAKDFNDVVWGRKTNDISLAKDILNESLNLSMTTNYDVIGTGVNSIDSIINGGFAKGQLNLIAAAPSVGKSAFALQVIANECDRLAHETLPTGSKQPTVYYVSLEMTGAEIMERLISNKAHKPFKFSKCYKKEYVEAEMKIFNTAIERVKNYPLHINASFKAGIDNIRNQVNQIVNSYDLKLLVIDHLHIMDYDKSKENNEISRITKILKEMAKEYNIPIILVSQVNKTESTMGFNSLAKPSFVKKDMTHANNNDDKGAIGMNDIRGSGAPVQDSSIVILMWKSKPEPSDTNVHFHIAKNRSGAPGHTTLTFYGSWNLFIDQKID
ncbi:MAG: DnaB-like helicase C-terminal domain-containing protein [Mycoplasmoidaceae bacterium]|nr:MAG: DnaB-like helicase C-terminal domain-containing protein [Mycoplasmoidaceae bacterium]